MLVSAWTVKRLRQNRQTVVSLAIGVETKKVLPLFDDTAEVYEFLQKSTTYHESGKIFMVYTYFLSLISCSFHTSEQSFCK